jgi:hypothetical protein
VFRQSNRGGRGGGLDDVGEWTGEGDQGIAEFALAK